MLYGDFFNPVIFFLFSVAISIEHLGLFILPLQNQSAGKVYEIIILAVVLKIIVSVVIGKEDNAHSVKERKKKAVK